MHTVLTPAELRVLEALVDIGECSVGELADHIERSQSYTSDLVSQLDHKGVIDARRAGKQKRLRLSSARALELFEQFVREYPHIEVPSLLGGAALRVLYFLEEPRSARDLAERAGVDRSTVYRSLDPLQHRGIVTETDGTYVLTDAFTVLARFAQELAHLLHRQGIEAHVEQYSIRWETLDEYLADTDDLFDAEGFHLTGPRRFSEYDLPLFVRDRYHYWYAPAVEDLSPEELCCHMLVIDDGSRYQTYCLLLIVRVSIDSVVLKRKARKYDVTTVVEDLLRYLNTEGENRTRELPPWEEFQTLAAEYDVDLESEVTE